MLFEIQAGRFSSKRNEGHVKTQTNVNTAHFLNAHILKVSVQTLTGNRMHEGG